MDRVQIAVLGAGVVGLSSAVRAIENVPGVEITLISEDFSPNTTGDGSAGLISPYLLGDKLPLQTMIRWFEDSWDFFLDHCLSPDAGTRGVGFLNFQVFSRSKEELQDEWSDLKYLSGYRELSQKELDMFPLQYGCGACCTSMFVECRKFLPYLLERFKRRGGLVQKRRVNRLSELMGEFDVVINCTGLEAAHIVPDVSVVPIRGQVYRVRAPWVKSAVFADEWYIIPNSDTVVLGGTHQEGDWNKRVNPEDSRRIWEGCCRLLPSLQKAEILEEWVGLRPFRPSPRLERDTITDANGRTLEVIHNYGHGGSGVTLSWGCAADVVMLLRDAISPPKPQSRL